MANQRGAAYFSLAAYRLGWAPTHLTLINLFLGLSASALVIGYAGPAAESGWAWWPIALAVTLMWQVAYMFDCADGQLARATGTGSAAGARVDILCDVAIQASFVAAIVTVVHAYWPHTPVWISAAFAALWMVNLVTSVLASSDTHDSLINNDSLPIRIAKLIRDFSFIIIVVGVALALWPESLLGIMIFFGAVNGLFLLASIAVAARKALRPAAVASHDTGE
ncbi:CDP-alcohol phosphatidyltransferase family protein [Natronoglycomyces albus]|uniref:CDP-alcohol phosphatidyltransferase family protein n=2 Tax=Natronoglycomyces albus TaxID=2811108 RepID=A0A895XP11_9ACTN|nr:CDP-alcohol phosphatidyltransferase family protein [Natronoglycomyces albus]